MEDSQLPTTVGTSLLVDLRGAQIVPSSSGKVGETDEIYLPLHNEVISHIALDIGGSLAKVVYFTRPPKVGDSEALLCSRAPSPSPSDASHSSPARPNGILDPTSLLNNSSNHHSYSDSSSPIASTSSHPFPNGKTAASSPSAAARRYSSTSRIPSSAGGRLNFVKFETTDLSSCISFIATLISASAAANGVPLERMKRNVKLMATGGGAHRFFERLSEELGVEVRREEEMECLVLGLGFVMEVPNEVFWYSDELVQAISHPHPHPASASSATAAAADPFPRPSPNPPQYSLSFDPNPAPAQFPCLLVNIGSGVSIIKVDDYGSFERISGTSLGGGTLWGLLSLLTGARSFDEMLSLADKGDNSTVDMLVGDIYGQDYEKIGLKSSTIASSFGKVFRNRDREGEQPEEGKGDGKGEEEERKFSAEDISRSLLYAISNNIGQIAYMNAEKHNLDRIYFGGCFIRGHAATISTLSYAIRFWSKGTKKALFLRHEGYLGSIGAWLKNVN